MHVTDAARAGERVSQWLLYGPAQLTRGPHAGGVAGALDAQGHAQYVYAEITGYFLQWLAWRARLDGATPELRARAEAAMRWLGRWVADARPATRVYLLDAREDWRNRASFTFDLAMALRGSAAAIAAGLGDRHATLVSALCTALARNVTAQGDLAAYMSPGEQPLPSRWSTARGAFLAKAAAGILRAAEEGGRSAESRGCCRRHVSCEHRSPIGRTASRAASPVLCVRRRARLARHTRHTRAR